jgi:lysylphosphatidylglycerol synthetase-like protein (DUF2156 family)
VNALLSLLQGPWDWREIFVQSLGFVAFAIFIVSYQIKDPRKTQLWFAPGNLTYGLQYFLMGHLSPALIISAAAVRDVMAAKASDRALKIASVIYLCWAWGVTIALAREWQEGLMAVSGTISTVAALMRGHFYRFRFLLMGRQSVVLCFNAWIGTWGGIIHLVFTLASNIIGTWKHYKRGKEPMGGGGTVNKNNSL